VDVNGVICFAASGVAQFTVPVSTGIIAVNIPGIPSPESGGNITIVPPVVQYTVNVTVVNGGVYTFDFNTQEITG
jgi:hypothetical protein